MSNILVIGYGSPLRGDDAVGQIVAQALLDANLGIKVLSLHQLTPELADDLARVDKAYFVDACIDINLEHPRVTEVQPQPTNYASHFSSPQNLLALTKQLYGCWPKVYLIEIPAESFEFGETLSGKAQKGVSETLELIHKLLSKT